jgi:anaerobic selenocysteine-containing dehydrogenase
VARALSTRELVVVVDSFVTDTTRLAHVVLPTTTLLEADDLLGAYGHHWLGSARPVVAPPPGVRTDLEILQELGRRLGMDGVLDGDARAWKERILRGKLAPHRVTLADIEEGYVKNPLVPEVLFADRKVPTASGRVNLVHEAPPAAQRDPAFPLLLMALSTDRAQSSQWSEKPDGPAVVTVHPDAAAGIPDGALARLESAIASMTVRVRHDVRQRRDVALTPKGGHVADGQCANRLLRARTTDLGEGGALYDEGVRLLPL